jgi:deoxyribodipyrimidine photo-lyase
MQAMNDASIDASLFWFRRDLRDYDNAGLYHALRASRRVYCVFVFDREILARLRRRADRRVEFIWASVRELKDALRSLGSDLFVLNDDARVAIPRLAGELKVAAVFTNEDYEPSARARDRHVQGALNANRIAFHAYKDQCIFAKDDLMTQAGQPFVVFTPYKNAWLRRAQSTDFERYPVEQFTERLAPMSAETALPSLESIGFERTDLATLGVKPGMLGARDTFDDFLGRIDHYRETRDYPSRHGVSYLSVHNRFGTLSIREIAGAAMLRGTAGSLTWLSELIWRDFYFQILYHFPRVVDQSFRPEFITLRWADNERLYAAWCAGETGYPIVDAGMRQLNQTGFMHNRLRMIVASFLTKDLQIDWRRGEQYFADCLNDYDLAANNGGWQWAASTGCDAQPYFRIFNPVTQSQKFDANGAFIRAYIPALRDVPDQFVHRPWTMSSLEQRAANCVIGRDYPGPVVDHAEMRLIALARYSEAAKGGK